MCQASKATNSGAAEGVCGREAATPCEGGAAERRDLRLMERWRKRGRSPCFEHFVSEGRKMEGRHGRPECDSVRNLWLHPEAFAKPRSG